MMCHECGDRDFCHTCDGFYCACYGCNCTRERVVFNRPKGENPLVDPNIRQVCLKCGFRKASPHDLLACPFCFPYGMVFEIGWMKDLKEGTVSTPIPPIRENQAHSFGLFTEAEIRAASKATPPTDEPEFQNEVDQLSEAPPKTAQAKPGQISLWGSVA